MANSKQTVNGDSHPTNGDSKDVKIAPASGISVLVVGGGVGGLVAALECVRKGHSVRVFEREAAITSGGDLFTIGLSGRQWFSHWPEMAKELAQISMKGMFMEYHKHTGETVIPALSYADLPRGAGPLGPPKAGGPPMLLQLRSLFHSMLWAQLQRLGIEVVCNKRTVEYFETENHGGVVTSDGDRTEADIVIAADGIGSKAQSLVMGEQVRGMYSGHSVFRTAYSSEFAFQDPIVRENFHLIDERPVLRAFYGPQTHAMVLSTKDIITWAIDHPGGEGKSESWNKSISNEEVLRTMDETPGWGDIFKTLVKTAPPEAVVDYPLVFRDPQPEWVSPNGRVVTLGDSAHTFIPTSGNGATQAIEDAITIASCLQLAGGKEHVPIAARVHAKLRFERVANAQRLGFYNKQRVQGVDWEAAKADPRKFAPIVPKWIFTHDPEKYVYDNYDDVVKSFEDGAAPFISTNVPPGSTYKPWTMRELLEDIRNNRQVPMEGDWS